ncbi:RecQ family helicase MusN [Penicillium frequentans]|uniref:RecQ family helicase MusN n=1 Tax=Penicillium frequentans TaxID=3151616 RepID=A0AAD6CQX5_9EURO|nr:RecQ family helicase MusN [Penicillium glabrum]
METRMEQAKSLKAPTASNRLKTGSSQPEDRSVFKFVALQASFIGVSIRQLKQTLQENSEVVYWQAIKGQPAPDLIAENKSLVSRIQAIEALQFQQACYNSRLLKKEKLKQCLIRVISQGLDPATMPDELSESRIVQSELKQIETKIWELLLQAKIFDLTKGSGMDLPTPESSDFLSDRHTSVDRLQDLVYTKEQSPQNQDTPPRSPKVSRRNLVTSVRQGISVDGSEEERVARKMRSSTIDLDDFEWSESDAEILEVFGSSNNG